MDNTVDYEAVNKAKWDERAPQHAASDDYHVDKFTSDANYISQTVTFDRPLLGDISGLNCAHLQCHIGTDTLSLARLGASQVTGLDFSSASLTEARKLASIATQSGGDKLEFVEASVYDAVKILTPASFDLVYTGIGALCWIPSIRDWGVVVAGLLKPGGRLFIREGHPVLWSLDDQRTDDLVVKYSYFEREEPEIFDDDSTYVDTKGYKFKATASAEFQHGMGEIVQALLDAGMRITGLKEHQTVPWPAIPGQMKGGDDGEFALVDRPWRLPHTYTLQAVKE